MYNRYIPQQDGTYQKNRIPTPPPPPPPEPSSSPSCDDPKPPYRKPEGAFSFLQQLLPQNLDTGDLLIIILLLLMDPPEVIMKQFKRAITDSDTENCVRYDKENKPGVANLMTIYAAVTGKTYDEIESEFAGRGYGAFKPAVGEAVVETLRPIREEASRLMKDKGYLENVYKNGAEKAAYVAEKTLRKVYKKVGFVAK